MEKKSTFTPVLGCYVDGSVGIFMSHKIVEFARSVGWTGGEGYTELSAACEDIMYTADEAELWLNDTYAVDGYSWFCNEGGGDFGLWITDPIDFCGATYPRHIMEGDGDADPESVALYIHLNFDKDGEPVPLNAAREAVNAFGTPLADEDGPLRSFVVGDNIAEFNGYEWGDRPEEWMRMK